MKVYTFFNPANYAFCFNKSSKTISIFENETMKIFNDTKTVGLYIKGKHVKFDYAFLDIEIKHLYCDSKYKIPFIVEK